jgi:hypothetical protein
MWTTEQVLGMLIWLGLLSSQFIVDWMYYGVSRSRNSICVEENLWLQLWFPLKRHLAIMPSLELHDLGTEIYTE